MSFAETSIVISLIRVVSMRYNEITRKVGYIYQDSWCYNLMPQLIKKTKDCFRDSHCGRIMAFGQIDGISWNDSYAIRLLISFYKGCKNKITGCCRNSLTAVTIKETREETRASFVQLLGVVLLMAVITNLVLSFMLHKQISGIGWLARGLFLLVFIPGLFSKTNWPAVKNSSIFLKILG